MAYLDEYSEFTVGDLEKAMKDLKKRRPKGPEIYYCAGAECYIDAKTGRVIESRPLHGRGQ